MGAYPGTRLVVATSLAPAVIVPAPTGFGPIDSANIQAAVNRVRATSIPSGYIQLQAGNYVITTSIDCTNILSEGQGISIIFAGAGKGATRITANLSAAFPVFDFSGSGRAFIRDLWVTGSTQGLQTCAFRTARASNGLGDQPTFKYVGVDGTYAVCAVAHFTDQWVMEESEVTGPIGIAWLSTDTLGINSAYTTLGSPDNTLGSLVDSKFSASGSVGIYCQNFGTLNILGASYCNLSGTSTAAFELTTAGSNTIHAQNFRMESNGASGTTNLIWMNGGSSQGSWIDGTWILNNAGSVVLGASSAFNFRDGVIRGIVVSQGTGLATYFNSGTCINVEIWNNSPGILIGNPSNPSGLLVHQGTTSPWSIASGATAAITQILPGGLALSNSGNRLLMGSGTPTTPGNINPTAGDYYFRTDTPSTANQRLYVCTTGGASPVWSGII